MKAAGKVSFVPAGKDSVYSASDGGERERIVYAGVFGIGTALVYTPTFSGLKEDIVLSKYTGKSEFTFLIETNGLTIKEDNGRLYLYDAKGNQAAEFSDIVCFDSEGSISFGSMRYETVTEGSEYVVTVCVDVEYLKSAVYPVYVDPTVTLSVGDAGLQDAPLYTGNANANGMNTLNMAGYVSAAIGTGRVIYKFPGLFTNATFSNLQYYRLISAKLCVKEVSGFSTSKTVSAYIASSSSWSESTVTYSAALYAASGSVEDSVTFSNPSGSWGYFDFTDSAQDWLLEEDYSIENGLILRCSDESSGTDVYKTFSSAQNSSNKPYISIDYSTVWTSVGSGGYPDVGKTITPGNSYSVYLYSGDYKFESCIADSTSSYTTTITVYNSAGGVVDSATSSSTASLTLNNLCGYYSVKVTGGTSTCFVRVKTSSGGAARTTQWFACLLKNFYFIKSEDTYFPENCTEYALNIPINNTEDPTFLQSSQAEVATFMDGKGYDPAGSQPYNGVAVYFDSSGECTHFAKIENGVVKAQLGNVELRMVPVVRHDNANVYYSDSYGTTIDYYELK